MADRPGTFRVLTGAHRGPALFADLFYGLRSAGLPVGLNEWMTLMEALAAGAIRPNLRDFYAVARALLVKDETLFDLWDEVFLAVFGDGTIPVAARDALLEWLENPIRPPQLTPEELAAMEALPLDELRKLFEERLKEQTERHDGGSKWIGTGGTSPFGHGGRNPAGIRIGGSGGGRSAVQIAEQRRYRDYRKDRILDTRALSVALKKLRRLERREGEPELDIEESIDATCRQAGELELVFRPPRENQARVLLLMDSGGSMDPFSQLCDRLFSAASGMNHWKKFEAFFFHNCPYSRVYESYDLMEFVPTQELIRERPSETFLLVVGDAYMAPYELTAKMGAIDAREHTRTSGFDWLKRLRTHFRRAAWLTPLPEGYARHSLSIQLVQALFPMFPLTVQGLEDAVDHLTKAKVAPAPEVELEDLFAARRNPFSRFFE
jgi:uncharacterized protein with von Willebrand factor type A (vWA) domain